MSFFPVGHNRDFTADQLRLLMDEAGFRDIEVSLALLRKFLIAFARK